MDTSLYNIEPQEFKIIDRHEVDNNVTYDLEPVNSPDVCSTCGFDTLIHYGTADRKVRDLNEFSKHVGLIIHSHRYHCNNCEVTFVPVYKSVDFKARMTNRMREYIQNQSLCVPFTRIKNDLDVSVSTIRDIFSDYVAELDSKHKLVAPKILGMDENYLNNQYRCIYTDIENGLIIDLTSDRKLRTVQNWIACLPQKDRVECVTMDMWGCYKDAVNIELPDVLIIVDKFHVIKNLNEALDGTRKAMRDKMTNAQVKQVKNSRWLLLRNNDDLSDADKIRLEILLTNYPQFREPYELKEAFRKIYEESDRKSAENRFDDWKINAVKYPLYKEFVNTVENWRTEIFNYFDKGYTNAVTEALNAVCKEIAAVGRGYTFEVLRAKILYGTKATKPAKYAYYTESKPNKIEILPDYIEKKGAVYALQDFRMGFMIPETQKKRIDVSSGTDIRLLQYYMRMSNFWELKP